MCPVPPDPEAVEGLSGRGRELREVSSILMHYSAVQSADLCSAVTAVCGYNLSGGIFSLFGVTSLAALSSSVSLVVGQCVVPHIVMYILYITYRVSHPSGHP